MMDTRETAQARMELLKRLREEHKETVKRTQELLREQNRVRQAVCNAVRESPKTAPEIALVTGMPAHEVLWHLASFRKYGLVVEAGMCGEYPLYRRTAEKPV